MLRFLCVYEHVTAAINRTISKAPAKATVLFVIALFIGAFVSARWIDGVSTFSFRNSSPNFSRYILEDEILENFLFRERERELRALHGFQEEEMVSHANYVLLSWWGRPVGDL